MRSVFKSLCKDCFRLIQHDIWQRIPLTASAGVSYNKFPSKMASDYQNLRGLTVILPDEAVDFPNKWISSKFHGTSKKQLKTPSNGVYNGTDLFRDSLKSLSIGSFLEDSVLTCIVKLEV